MLPACASLRRCPAQAVLTASLLVARCFHSSNGGEQGVNTSETPASASAAPPATAHKTSRTKPSARASRRAKQGKKAQRMGPAGEATAPPTSRIEDMDALLATAPTSLHAWGSPSSHTLASSSSPAITGADDVMKVTGSTVSPSPDDAVATQQQQQHQRNVQLLNEGDTVASGARYSALEQIERRRRKVTVAEAEFTVGVTERLFPEIQRLPALHEIHFGDAVVREVDSRVFFAHLDAEAARGDHTDGDVAARSAEREATRADAPVVSELSDEAFAAFDVADGNESTPAGTISSTAHTAATTSNEPVASLMHTDDTDDTGHALVPHAHGETPWFIPTSGIVRISPLGPADALRLMAFVLYLRHPEEIVAAATTTATFTAQEQVSSSSSLMESVWRACWDAQTCEALIPSPQLRAKVRATSAHLAHDAEDKEEQGGGGGATSVSEGAPALLQLSDVIAYLDTAPVPVLGFTEVLHPREEVHTPAFVFTLYVENVSVQNALGHLATLFAIPQRAFCTHTAASKMSCTSLICAVEHNRLTRELLLLVNTMRHPGFVLRISDIREVDPTTFGERGVQHLFGAMARWQPLYEVEMLLRRVSARSRDDLAHRLRALQNVGAVFFCANREASLARAATDVLHGFYRSAILNALQRHNPPLAMRQFLSSPNVISASRARRVSTDPTIRHVLKTFIQTNGDWKETVARAPYVWRRRWINALRCTVWNTMASRRLRHSGRHVVVGDLVVRPEFRADVQQRQVMTLKAEHMKLVETPEEAATCTLEDVFLPFLRGRYPAHLVAPDSSQHPVLTAANMFSLVQSLHAAPLLTGLSEISRTLLDIRADVSPLLFRRLLLRPLALQFTLLEDKAPHRSIHFDAARLLASDRWATTVANAVAGASSSATTQEKQKTAAEAAKAGDEEPASVVSCPFLSGAATALVPQATVLASTSIGDRLTSGCLAEEFFDIPTPHDYLALGHAHRYLDGDLFTNAPHTPPAELDDRLYTVHLRAVVQNGSVGLTQLLREYFVLSGVADELDSALQHKVHRLRRELDPETPWLTAPSYCTGCYSRDHDALDTCAEFLFKKNQSSAWLRRRQAVSEAVLSPPPVPAAVSPSPALAEAAMTSAVSDVSSSAVAVSASPSPPSSSPSQRWLTMTWELRRRNAEEKWGVHLSKSLGLVGIEQVRLIRRGAIECTREPDAERVPWPAAMVAAVRERLDHRVPTDVLTPRSEEATEEAVVEFLAQVVGEASSAKSVDALAATDVPLPLVLETDNVGSQGDKTRLGTLLTVEANAQPKKVHAPLSGEKRADETTTSDTLQPLSPSTGLLRRCGWTLSAVNGVAVHNRRDVAAVFLQHQQDRVISLAFRRRAPLRTAGVPVTTAETTAATTTTVAAAASPAQEATMSPANASDLSPFLLALSNPAVQAALRQTSYASRRWLSQLPPTLRMVLTKHRRHYHKSPSWGIQLDARDMSLTNFSALMVQYLFASTSKQRLDLVERAYVSSLSPSNEVFARDDDVLAAQLFGDILPALEPILNSVYTVTAVNGKRVRGKVDATAAMAAFQRAVQQSRQLDGRRHPDGQVHLAITLTRKPETMTWLSRIASVEEGGEALTLPPPLSPSTATGEQAASAVVTKKDAALSLARDLDGFELAQPEEVAVADTDPRSSAAPSTSSTAASTTKPSWSSARDADVLCVLPTSSAVGEEGASPPPTPPTAALAAALNRVTQAPWLSPRQLKAAAVTIAVNRRATNAQTRGKWGLRVQRGTLRLLSLQKNQYFGFQVYAAKRAQAVRVADTLRDVPPPSSDAQGRADLRQTRGGDGWKDDGVVTDTPRPPATRTYDDYLYLVEAVNHVPVRSHEGLRQALQLAAAPTAASGLLGGTAEGGVGEGGLAESVTLQLRQFSLARVPVPIHRPHARRLGAPSTAADGSGSTDTAVGLHVNKDMCVTAIDEGGLCARALRATVAPHCSLTTLIRGPATDAYRHGVLLSALQDALAAVRAQLPVSDTIDVLTAPTQRHSSASTARAAWRYELDEDDEAHHAPPAAARADQPLPPPLSSANLAEALMALATKVEALLESYRLCSGVDATALLEVCVVNEFCESCKPHLPTPLAMSSASGISTETMEVVAAAVAPLWRTLEQRLKELREGTHVRWRVVYAAKTKQTLRTPADLIAAVGPHVHEEVLVLQQCIVLE